MIILTQRCSTPATADTTLSLEAEARSRPRQHCQLDNGEPGYLRLPRGTRLQAGDCLASESGDRIVQIIAKPESILTVTAPEPEELLKAAYHLGNRHVPLEITCHYLRLSPDPVLEKMLQQMGLTVTADVTPFFPERGAYHHH